MLYHPLAEEGQGLLEYALIMILIAIVVIAILALFGPALSEMYNSVLNLFP
jgi:pilus assembly protein Flp/PilA